MTKRFARALFLMLGILFSGLTAQTNVFPRRQYVVNPKLPSVYIRQESPLKRTGAPEADGDQRRFFRLYNNLSWPIRLTVSTAATGGGDVQLDYELLNSEDKVSGGFECHVCTMIPLGPGKNLSFSLPQSEVETSSRIRVEYSFWWESSRDVGTENEPFHYVLLTFGRKSQEFK